MIPPPRFSRADEQIDAARELLGLEGTTRDHVARLWFLDSLLGVVPRLAYEAPDMAHALDRRRRQVPLRREKGWQRTQYTLCERGCESGASGP